MSIEICIHETHTDPEKFTVTPQAVYQLFKHGWEPPAGASYRGHAEDGSELVIPARSRQTTAAPTHQQIMDTILNRIGARMKLGGGLEGNFIHSYNQGIAEAAEAIQDLFGTSE